MAHDQQLEQIARRIADDLVALRQARFVTTSVDLQKQIIARVRAILSGRTIEDSPD